MIWFYRHLPSIGMNAMRYSLLFICATSMAAEPLSNENYWVCTATDSENKTWTEKTNYDVTAKNRAFEACKKESAVPMSCAMNKKACEQFRDGHSVLPMWRCVAFDQKAHRWPSPLFSVREDAALAAKSICLENSEIPASCYINLATCQNINEIKP